MIVTKLYRKIRDKVANRLDAECHREKTNGAQVTEEKPVCKVRMRLIGTEELQKIVYARQSRPTVIAPATAFALCVRLVYGYKPYSEYVFIASYG